MPAKKKPGAAKKSASKTKQVIGSRVKITLDDARGKETLTLETPGGLTITLNNARSAMEITDGHGNSVKLDPSGVTILAAARVTLNAAEVKVNAENVVVDAAHSKFNGVVQCDTLITNSVISASYTPGAGNLL